MTGGGRFPKPGVEPPLGSSVSRQDDPGPLPASVHTSTKARGRCIYLSLPVSFPLLRAPVGTDKLIYGKCIHSCSGSLEAKLE